MLTHAVLPRQMPMPCEFLAHDYFCAGAEARQPPARVLALLEEVQSVLGLKTLRSFPVRADSRKNAPGALLDAILYSGCQNRDRLSLPHPSASRAAMPWRSMAKSCRWSCG